MPFVLPNFNIVCNVDQPDVVGVPGVPTGPPRLANQPCALVYGRRVNVAATGDDLAPDIPCQAMNLLLPKGTDVRGPQDDVSFDMIECPAGTGRWYWVIFVDDIGRGYANEHRTASMVALTGTWAAPYP